MQIISIEKNYNKTEFKAKKFPSSVSIAPILAKNELVNKMQSRDAKIKEFLLEIIEKNLSFSMREIAEKLGFKNIHAVARRVYQNPNMKELWEKVMQITAQKSDDINNKIKSVLDEVVQTQAPTSAKEIAKKVGINPAACRQRIRLNPELKELFYRRNEKQRSVKSAEALNLEEKIKQILENTIQNNESISSKQIAEQFGLQMHQIQDRIKRNPILKALWDKLEHFKIPKKKQKDIENDEKIKTVLENAIKQGKYLSVSDVAKLTGLSENACLHKFSNNAEIKEIWRKVNKSANSMQDNFDKIRNALLYAIKTKEYMTIEDIGKRIGMKPTSVSSRFAYSPELKGLWLQVRENNKKCSKVSERIKAAKSKTKDIMSPEESQEVNELLKITLETAIANNTPLNTATISKNIGISEREVSRRANLPEIKPLWIKCKQIALTIEKEKIDKIAEYFENAIENGQILTIAETSHKFNIGQKAFTRYIYRIPRLNELWNQIEHKGGNIKNRKTENENRQIIGIMQKAIKQKQPLLLDDIAKDLDITVPTLKGRIDLYPEIKELWESVPRKKTYVEPTESVEKTEKIKTALKNRIAENKPFMLLDIAKELNIELSSLYLKVRRTPILTELWKSAEKKFVTDGSLEINTKIRDILLDAIEKGEYINNRVIAKRANITYDICTQRIQRYEDLNELTEQVRKIKKSIYEQENKNLKQILENAIDTNTPLTINQIINLWGYNDNIFDYRIAHSKELKSLWTKVKKIDVNILKEINNLSVGQKLSNEEIKQKLNLNDDKFEDLMLRYERIKTILTKNKNSQIKDEDILNWAVLSKREFELAVCEIFEKMGYKSGTTRYSRDKGIDVIASKDGKVSYIECMHNLYRAVEPEELLALQGNKYYFNADDIIYVATSGITKFGQKFIDKLGTSFKVLELEDLILLAKKYKIDINNLKEKGDIKFPNNQIYGDKWKFVSKKKPEEVFEWRKLRQEEFEKRIKAIFMSKGYSVLKADELNLSGYYVITKNNKKTIIKCHNSNKIPTLDEIKSLYGLKDFYDAKNVILIAPSAISISAKEFIDKINFNNRTKNTYKLLSIDDVINDYQLS